MKNITRIEYRNWEFEIEKDLNVLTYNNTQKSGSESCICEYCKNYLENRDTVFPREIHDLFELLGIDYKKEVEIETYEVLPNGIQNIAGWFHFKGKILKGKNCRIELPHGGFTLDMTKINDNFSIAFFEGNALTHFEDKNGLIQIEFTTKIHG